MDCQPEISTFPDNTNKLCILRLNFHVFTKFLFPFYIDLGSNYVIMKPSQLERVFPKQDAATAGIRRLRPYGQPGRMPKTAMSGLATSVALLIELKAQFYKLVTINHCAPRHKLVKWSIRVVKVIFAI